MFAQILSTILPIVLIALIGYLWSYLKLSYDGQFISQIVMNIATPCLILSTLLKVELSVDLLSRLSLVTFVGVFILLAFNGLLLKGLRLPIRTYLPTLSFANTGNMGIPIALFAFGEYALALALVVFMATSLVHFSLGVAIVGGKHPLKTLLTSPVFYSAVISVLMLVTQWQLPEGVFNAIDLLGGMSVPLMLFSLGASLQSLRVSAVGRSFFLAIVRLVMGTATGFLVCWIFDIKQIEAGVVILVFAMPSAVFNYLLALNFKRSPEDVAGVVVFSTLLSLITLPVLLWYLLERI